MPSLQASMVCRKQAMFTPTLPPSDVCGTRERQAQQATTETVGSKSSYIKDSPGLLHLHTAEQYSSRLGSRAAACPRRPLSLQAPALGFVRPPVRAAALWAAVACHAAAAAALETVRCSAAGGGADARRAAGGSRVGWRLRRAWWQL